MKKNMTTDEILLNLKGNGGFNNWHHWNKKEVAEWVKANYPCSSYVAKRVAEHIA